MNIYVEKICDVFRPYSAFGFVKEEDRDKIAIIVDEIKNERNLMIKESSYNEGFIAGVRSAQRMSGVN